MILFAAPRVVVTIGPLSDVLFLPKGAFETTVFGLYSPARSRIETPSGKQIIDDPRPSTRPMDSSRWLGDME
jgi:hypothetical protein